jgi:hypothetical protein
MDRQTAIVDFFRARLDEEAAELDRMTNAPLVQGYVRVYGDRLKANIEADRELLARYDDCVNYGGCPGNEALDVARAEYENHVFPARIARFSDHPTYATLALDGRFVPEVYLAARKAEGAPHT